MGESLTEVAARLYTLPPEEFIAARNEAIAAARAAGDRELAQQLAELRRPTVGAWLVNLLAHRRPDLIGDLMALGERLRAAQRNLHGETLRELSQRRREMVTTLARESRVLAVAAGRRVRDALPLAEVEATLTAALAEAEVAEQVRRGRLTKAIEYAGFGEIPRPQLRLVRGGDDVAIESAPARPAEPDTAQPPTERTTGGRGPAERGPGRRGAPERTAAGPTTTQRPGPRADQAAADEEAAAERAAAERIERERAAEAAARQRAAEERRRTQAAYRELLAARTALAEAEAQRAAAEKAVVAARRRVEAALAAVEAGKRNIVDG